MVYKREKDERMTDEICTETLSGRSAFNECLKMLIFYYCSLFSNYITLEHVLHFYSSRAGQPPPAPDDHLFFLSNRKEYTKETFLK